MRALLCIAFLAFVAYVNAQTCSGSYFTCTSCEADALGLNCSYCANGASSFCIDTSTAQLACSTGTVNPTTCDDCATVDASSQCIYPAGHTVNKLFADTCNTINAPANASSATGSDPCSDAVAADTAACQTAILAYACSLGCGACSAATFNPLTYKPCNSRCSAIVSACSANTVSACNSTSGSFVCNDNTGCGDIDAKSFAPSSSAAATAAGTTATGSGANTLFVKELVALVAFLCGAAVLLL